LHRRTTYDLAHEEREEVLRERAEPAAVKSPAVA